MSNPAEPRDAATVVVLRDAPGSMRKAGLEVYLVKRSRALDFMAGAHVFPGGRLDKSDSSASACALLSAGTAALAPWVRWVTPEISPKRFDARFFLARAPEGQEPRVDGREATEGLWIAPADSWRKGVTAGSMPADSTKLK